MLSSTCPIPTVQMERAFTGFLCGLMATVSQPEPKSFKPECQTPRNQRVWGLGFGVLERPFPHSILLFSGALIWIFGILAEV